MEIKTKIKQLVIALLNNIEERKKWLLALSCLVVFFTTYLLILPAFTLDKEEAAEQGGIDMPAVEQSANTEELAEDSSENESAVISSGDVEKEESARFYSEDVEKEEVAKPASEDSAKDAQTEAAKTDVEEKSADIILENKESDDFSVAVESKDAVLSEDMSVAAREIDQSNKKQKKEYESLYNDALEAVQKAQEEEGLEKPSDFAFAKFYDISLMDGDDEVEPESAVDVKISFSEELQKELKVTDPNRLHIVHFAMNKDTGEVTPEVLDTESTDITIENKKVTEAAFTTDSFSVFAVVYTVDFQYEVDGKQYNFSMDGGGFISLKSVVEALKVTDSAEAFVANIERAEFSNPELVWVGRAESSSTVGELKNANGLEPEYSAELTIDQIAEIDAQTVKAGEWVLISLKPFTSEETLTVTMNTGEVFVISVTDAMDNTTPYDKGTTFTAYDTRPDGFTINLFDYGPENDLDNGSNNLQDKGWQYNSGINSGHDLKFTAYGKKPSEVKTNGQNVLTMNHFSGTEAATQGIVDKNLSGGYPNLSGGGESLGYLFNTTPDGNNKKVYKDVSGLFQKDADGKYYYDSNVNYAYYDPNQGDSGNFQLSDTFPEEGSDWGVGFFPFSPWDGSKTCIHWNGYCPPRGGSNSSAGYGTDGKYHSEYYYNHHFGMTLEGTFQMSPDGKLNNHDLVFNFSGDDDLWVYIDDVLVLDIGGVHNPVGGSINFRTGAVSVDSAYQVNSVINDSQKGPAANTTIEQAFAAAGKTWNNEPYADHTIKVFYVERGGCYSNCRMEFNLTRFKDVEFDKKDQYGDPVENAEFSLFKEDGTPLVETYIDHEDNDTVKYRDYVRYSDENGYVKFDHVPVGTYYIRETAVPEGYIKDEATYTAKIIVERNDDGTYSVHSYVLRNGEQTEIVRNVKQEDITLSLDKKWKIGETEVNPTSASASFKLMRTEITEEPVRTPAVVKLQDSNGEELCSNLNIHAGDTIKISGYMLQTSMCDSAPEDDVLLGSKTIGTLKTENSVSDDVTYTVGEEDIVSSEVILKLNSKSKNDFDTLPTLSIESYGTDPDPVTNTEAIEEFNLPDGGSWSKSFTEPVYDEHGRKYTYYFVETSNSEGTTPIYVDGNGQVISDPASLATNEDTTQTIINKLENGYIEITKNLQKNGAVSNSLTGTFYYAVYAAADVEDGAPKEGAQAVHTGSITVDEDDNGTHTETIRVPVGTYYVYELTGAGGQPIVDTSRQRIGQRTYQVTGSGTSTEVGVADGSAAFTNNYETVEKTATKSWSDNEDHPTIYFKLFYISRGEDAEHGSVIEFVEVDGAEIKELSGLTSVTWNDLPKYDANGEEYEYVVKEYIKVDGQYVATAPDGYVKSEHGLTVNNTKSEGYDPKTQYVGTKTWEDTANNGATRPDSIHVDLYANGGKIEDEDCVAQWVKGTGDEANVWTYTFSDLPVFDENGVYIKYTAVETPVSGYTPGETTQQETTYSVISGSVDGNIERVTSCRDLDITLDSETDLAYVVIKKSAKKHLIWTQRPISQAEKNRIYADINQVSGFIGELSDSTVEFASGLPAEHEFFHGTVTTSKKSDKVMHVEFANHQTWAQLCYGSYKYNYDPGRTDFINSLVTTEVSALKSWQDSDGQTMTPLEGTTVTFDLYANGEQQYKPVVLNGKVDVSELSDDEEEAKTQELNAEAIEANAYEKEAWQAYWGNLPTHNAAGEEITYTVKESTVPGFENMNPDGVSSGGTIINKQIVTEIHILKKGENEEPLTGAKFRLDQYNDSGNIVIKSWGPEEVSSEQGKEGTLTFEGLGIGKYTLVETDCPDGYVKISDDPEFEVVQNEDGTLKVQFTNTEEVTYDAESSTFNVVNTPGAALPNTGGSGITLIYLLGFMLTVLAGAGLILRKKGSEKA